MWHATPNPRHQDLMLVIPRKRYLSRQAVICLRLTPDRPFTDAQSALYAEGLTCQPRHNWRRRLSPQASPPQALLASHLSAL
jgi:hypothetical protein